MSRATVYPFTQIYEDVMSEMRESSTETSVKNKYRRRVNQIYMFDIPNRYEWDWLRRTSTILAYAPYETGTVAATNDSASITGSSTVWTSSHTGWRIKFSGDDTVYTFTYVSGTTGTISPVYQGDTESGMTYSLYQVVYALPSDFSKFTLRDPRLYYYSSGVPTTIKWFNDSEFYRRSTYTANDSPYGWREYPALTSLGYKQIELSCPVSSGMSIGVEYIKLLSEMWEYTDTAKTGSTNTKVLTTTNLGSVVSAGMYIRVDADAEWSLITAVAADTTTGNGLTVSGLRIAPDNTDPITICSAPEMPLTMQDSLFYGACMLTGLEQNSPATQGYVSAYVASVDQGMASKNRKRYGDQQVQIQARRG